MRRIFKQFIYGVFYLIISALVLGGFYSAIFKPAPSQPDNKLNREVLVPELPKPVLVLEDLSTKIVGNQVRVIGILKNGSPLIADKVVIVAVVFNKEGRELFTSQTLIEEVKAFEIAPFTVFFPKDENLTQQVDLEATKVFFEIQ